MTIGDIEQLFDRVQQEIRKAVVGQTELVEGVLFALFCEGNVLIEGPPGLGKTLLVNSLSKVLDSQFGRVQFTPDLMPSDITGHSVFDMREKEFTFNRGPIFTNLLLADEINRAPAKTQAALLEAMQERQVTVDGKTYPLPRPFITIATQNPLEQEGTYPLPEAQLDRFLFKLLVDYPTDAEEQDILKLYANGRDSHNLSTFGLESVMTAKMVRSVQEVVRGILIEPQVITYISAIVQKTRAWNTIEIGASPRAGVGLLIASRAAAACRGRDFVIPDDVKDLAPSVLRHRIRLQPDVEVEGVSEEEVIRDLLDSVEAPKR
ncbi:AAA family ATPase [Stratiformator vulcanicus]|uniref:ATPase family associated with various cellular activities (AAA) n=1 Tax=Stratiformator vulcanicus TaxID=2527980 RepID=A0A517QYL9_9PLAN|nr:MoxR family ATPase [Stratiformator vulcanicus]QDT36757.1 ATPase family associated with various cellular activities (AAA) [Stratiformator vulcanicus]